MTFELQMMDEKRAGAFCADSISPIKILVESNLIKLWAHVWLLSAPSNHPRNKSRKDPFYAEIRKEGNRVSIPLMLFGDYGQLQLDKYYWPDMHIEWIFEITR